MYLLNVGYRWKLATSLDDLDGVVILPSGNDSERLLRSKQHEFKRMLFDPQLYLAELDAEKCTLTCARLATYSWFSTPGLPVFDSSEMKRRDWEKEVRKNVAKKWPAKPVEGEDDTYQACLNCLELQCKISCTHLILPSPLILEREDESATQAMWLDKALEVASELEVAQPLLATVAVSDTVLNEESFTETGFLDTVVDQITARDGIDGVYIVVAQSTDDHPFATADKVNHAYLHLTRAFAERGYDFVIPNFVDLLGLACTAVGANSFASDASQSRRRLSLPAFREDTQGGKALPHFYSHTVAAELRTEADLDRIVKKRLLSRIRDKTEYSENLLEELSAGGSAANLPAWAESQNNLAAAQKHFVTRLAAEKKKLIRKPLRERPDQIREWLETAAANNLLLNKRLGKPKLQGHFVPAESWLDRFNAFTE